MIDMLIRQLKTVNITARQAWEDADVLIIKTPIAEFENQKIGGILVILIESTHSHQKKFSSKKLARLLWRHTYIPREASTNIKILKKKSTKNYSVGILLENGVYVLTTSAVINSSAYKCNSSTAYHWCLLSGPNLVMVWFKTPEMRLDTAKAFLEPIRTLLLLPLDDILQLQERLWFEM